MRPIVGAARRVRLRESLVFWHQGLIAKFGVPPIIDGGGLEHVHQLEPPAEPDGGLTSLAGHHPFDAIVLGAENVDHEAHFSPHRCRADAGPSYGTDGGFAPGNP
jgi:hypothetical protein